MWARSTRAPRARASSSSTRRRHRVSGAAEHAQIYPQPGRVEHDPRRSGATRSRDRRRACGRRSSPPHDLAAVGITNQRETDGRVGPPHRARRSTTRSSGRTRGSTARSAALAARRRHGPPRAATGLPLASYFSGLSSAGCSTTSGRARARPRPATRSSAHRFLARLEPHRRADGGAHVTDVTNASRTQLMDLADARLGRRAARRCSASRGRCCRTIRSSSGVLRRRGAGASRGRADRRHPRRPAGGAGRAGMLPAGRGQEHLRHRLLHADEHRRPTPFTSHLRPPDDASAYKFGEQPRSMRSRARRRHRRAGAVAARQSRPHRSAAPRSRRWRGGARQWRRLLRAGVLGPLRAVLERPTRAASIVGLTRFATSATSPAPRSRPRPTRPVTCCEAMEKDTGVASTSCASTAAWSQTRC